MARLENTFKKSLLAHMGTRWAVQSHEDSYSEGIADLSFSAGGVNGWIELKQVRDWPKMENTLVKPKHYTPQQVNWLKVRGKKGGNCFVMVKVGKSDYFLFSWCYAGMVRGGMDKASYFTYCLARWEGLPDPDQLLGTLIKTKLSQE